MTEQRRKRIPIDHRDPDSRHGGERDAEDTPADPAGPAEAPGRGAPQGAESRGGSDRGAGETPPAAGSGGSAGGPGPGGEEQSRRPASGVRGDGPVEDAAGPQAAPRGRTADPAEGALSSDARAEALEAERDAYLDDLRRLKAEFENYRRRSQRELTDSRANARAAVVLEFLPVLDNLERALSAAEEHEEAKLVDGVRMTHRSFVDLLRREGVEPIDPLGELFDPEVHEALFTQASRQPEGTIIHVMERGYRHGDRVLRPAKVAVSTGPEGLEG